MLAMAALSSSRGGSPQSENVSPTPVSSAAARCICLSRAICMAQHGRWDVRSLNGLGASMGVRMKSNAPRALAAALTLLVYPQRYTTKTNCAIDFGVSLRSLTGWEARLRAEIDGCGVRGSTRTNEGLRPPRFEVGSDKIIEVDASSIRQGAALAVPSRPTVTQSAAAPVGGSGGLETSSHQTVRAVAPRLSSANQSAASLGERRGGLEAADHNECALREYVNQLPNRGAQGAYENYADMASVLLGLTGTVAPGHDCGSTSWNNP